MDRVTDIISNGDVTTAIFHSDDHQEFNLLRRAALGYIQTWAVFCVTFHVNITAKKEDALAQRLGMLIIDNEAFERDYLHLVKNDRYIVRVDIKGGDDVEFTTNDIELPWRDVTPIMPLLPGHHLVCDLHIKRFDAQGHHIKHCPLATFAPIPVPEGSDGFGIRMMGIGMLSGEEILKRALDKMVVAAQDKSDNIFMKIAVPPKYRIQM